MGRGSRFLYCPPVTQTSLWSSGPLGPIQGHGAILCHQSAEEAGGAEPGRDREVCVEVGGLPAPWRLEGTQDGRPGLGWWLQKAAECFWGFEEVTLWGQPGLGSLISNCSCELCALGQVSCLCTSGSSSVKWEQGGGTSSRPAQVPDIYELSLYPPGSFKASDPGELCG